ncbi:hypothetical protein D3C71_1401920 [compost metagenome]
MGKRPCSSGIRSLGLDRWNAPDAMNRMWSVLIMPYLVDTVVPSTSGSRSRCTPCRDTSAPLVSWRAATLSISSMKTMPFCSALATARVLISSSLTSLPASSSVMSLRASAILSLRVLRLSCPIWLNMPRNCSAISSMPWGPMISSCGRPSATSISISLSSSAPSRSFLRKTWRAVLSAAGSVPAAARAGGISTSRMRSSAASSARARTFFISDSRVCLTAISARSRMMESTSLPT